MSFFKSLFGAKETPIQTYADFWNWFKDNEQKFFQSVKNQDDVMGKFLDKLGPKLDQLRPGYWFLTGMAEETTAELILTADGNLKMMAFVEEIVAAAPKLPNWKFTALKQADRKGNFSINMNGLTFDKTTIDFYPIQNPHTPDSIDIALVCKNASGADQKQIDMGVFLALENNIGELNAATLLDKIEIVAPEDAIEELVPFEKLESYIVWRQKEFIEKYDGVRHNTDKDNYSALTAELEDGSPLVATVNSDVLKWDSKASHPWIAVIVIKFDGEQNNGMPNEKNYTLMNEIEDKAMLELLDQDGYINVGRETARSVREVFFACVDFRKPSKVLDQLVQNYRGKIEIDFEIYKDKYWESFERFR